MAVSYERIDGKLASAEWHAALSAARKDGVEFHLNSGHRSIAQQRVLYNQNMVSPGVRKPGRPLTAFPNPNAPHIREGRIDHALDVESNEGGSQRLAAWMRKQDLPANFTVSGEPWHIETTAAALRSFAEKHGDPLRELTPKERRMAQRLLFHRHRMDREAKTGKGRLYRQERLHATSWKATCRAQMLKLKAHARTPGRGGWAKDNRGRRYQILKAVVERRIK